MFSIITPTYKRKEKLMRAVASLEAQSVTDWEMIVINDSPDDESYRDFAPEDTRIKYLVNESNRGVNYSRNRGLDELSPKSLWVIFLDDDDYLAPDALATFTALQKKHPQEKWFVTNRAYEDGTPVTRFPKNNTVFSYAWDYLITKRCKGDATHCIDVSLIMNSRFSKKIRQAEEWFFFYQIGLRSHMYYHSHNSTLTNGYDVLGLNFRKRSFGEEVRTIKQLTDEGFELSLTHHFTFILYMLGRLFRGMIR
jgi:glycosyltransferase involved in cell wall biosynthesis